VELVLIIAAAGGLLGCFGTVARLDVSKGADRDKRRPISRCAVR
jgi:hypothetical protein